ncbi:hypothetical protein DEE89_12110 [Ralstonia pickettii]|nr:hypothetical protein [Ralstonia pickettii]MBA9852001.1 hypothetical protein [Ralstonia pickettii]MBA9919984.1 hypothetical protein [Ralstonia pickettii]MBA9959086.1 hypothetical protein [Ralstonia pickettii]MBA9964536.1 hypothetical protein [Ralstonia pickettii]
MIKVGINVLIVIAMAVGLVATLERLYLVNGSSYPSFLAEDAGNLDEVGLAKLRATSCKDESVEVYKKDDVWVLRCGFAYYQGHTYISHTDPMGVQ